MHESEKITITSATGRGPNLKGAIGTEPKALSRQAFPSDTLIALIGLAIVDLIMKVKGFPCLHRVVRRWRVSAKRKPNSETIARICAAVDRACTYYPRQAMCLQRSAVAACLLRREGLHALLVLGCRVMPYSGHAWVEVDNKVVNDDRGVQRYYSVLERC